MRPPPQVCQQAISISRATTELSTYFGCARPAGGPDKVGSGSDRETMRKPAVFLAHGSPMSALGGDAHAAALRAFGDKHPDARGMLIVSAHWQVSRARRRTAWDPRALLYDFGGFPEGLYRIQYPSPGDPGLAARIAGVLLAGDQGLDFDPVVHFDHGA